MGGDVKNKNPPRQPSCKAMDARRKRLHQAAPRQYVIF